MPGDGSSAYLDLALESWDHVGTMAAVIKTRWLASNTPPTETPQHFRSSWAATFTDPLPMNDSTFPPDPLGGPAPLPHHAPRPRHLCGHSTSSVHLPQRSSCSRVIGIFFFHQTESSTKAGRMFRSPLGPSTWHTEIIGINICHIVQGLCYSFLIQVLR